VSQAEAGSLLHDPDPFDIGEGQVAVLCLHGLTGRPYEIRPVAEALARTGMRAVGPTLAGHGDTPEALTRIEFEQWLGGVRDAYRGLRREHETVMVAGLSLGGLLALALAAEEPVDALAVIGTPMKLRFPIPQLAPLLRRVLPYVRKRGSDIRDPAARARHPSYDVMPVHAVYQLTRLQGHVRDALPRIDVPILVAHGAHDATADPADARLIEFGPHRAGRQRRTRAGRRRLRVLQWPGVIGESPATVSTGWMRRLDPPRGVRPNKRRTLAAAETNETKPREVGMGSQDGISQPDGGDTWRCLRRW
jgi:carboxylesterase